MNQNLFSFSQNSNNSLLYSSNINSSFANNNMNINLKPLKIKKRTYNEFMESYKQSHYNEFFSEAECLQKSINLKLRKNLEETKNLFFNKEGNNIIKNQKKIVNNDFPQISHPKKGINIDTKKKFLNEEDSGFYSDLDDTKENSFYSLNVSFDYPEINLDKSIKDKLISNAIELEKTFNRIFNVKNMPNKK